MLASARMTGSTLMCILNYHRWAALLNRHYCKWMVCCMPNHIHFLVGIQPKADGTMQASSPTNISQVVRIFKGRVAHRAGHSVFQRSFYDHIIRTEADYWAIVQYIDENPLKWVFDPLYQEGTP